MTSRATGTLFTICTPTYNRADTLGGVYRSLSHQTIQDFEWLVVDDGSGDNTRAIVDAWCREAGFPIRYFYQANRGKPAAINRGLAESRGQFFLVFDSDDRCVPNALERFCEIWESIPERERDQFSGVTVHCMDSCGNLIGRQFSQPILDAHPYEVAGYFRRLGEKWGFHRTALLRAHGYPVFPNENFIPEGVLWNRVGARYKLRYCNEALRIYEPRVDGLNAKIQQLKEQSPNGSALYYAELMTFPVPITQRVVAGANYVRYGLHAGRSVETIIRDAPNKFFVGVTLASGVLSWLIDLVRRRAH